MTNTPSGGVWEERWHPLREEWVVVAAHRQDRPWSGEQVGAGKADVPDYVPDCYLCPGNERVSGRRNPEYTQTFVFDNDHPCVAEDAPAPAPPLGQYQSRAARGIARVLCYSPKHNLTLAEMSAAKTAGVMRVWQAQQRELAARPDVAHVLIFENKGDVVGVSNPHPHGQIYATNFVFKTIENEARICAAHLARTGRVLFGDILTAETEDGRRIIAQNAHAVAFVPYFARYAYEVYVAPRASHAAIADLGEGELGGLADVLHTVLVRFDNLWQMSFPYVMALHQAPTDGGDYAGFHFHIEFHPPLRKPNLLKYLGGPETGAGNFISDTTPEQKADELRRLPDTHYRHVAGTS